MKNMITDLIFLLLVVVIFWLGFKMGKDSELSKQSISTSDRTKTIAEQNYSVPLSDDITMIMIKDFRSRNPQARGMLLNNTYIDFYPTTK